MPRFCSACGTALEGASRCPRCSLSALPAPTVLVACFVFQGERLLWMRRAEEPQRGFWAIPAGYLEFDESLAEAAARELREETGVVLAPDELHLYSLGSIPAISQVYVAFRASVLDAPCAPGAEALETRFFAEHELPWERVAFPSANYAIRMAYDDIRRGSFGLYVARHERGELADQFSLAQRQECLPMLPPTA